MQALTGLSGLSALVGGGFSPLSLSGLVGWWRANQGLFQNSNGTTAATADGDPVGYWGDLSGLAHHATQATGSKQFTLKLNILNGQPVLRADAVDDCLDIASFLPTTGLTVCLVWAISGNRLAYVLDSNADSTRGVTFQTKADGSGYFWSALPGAVDLAVTDTYGTGFQISTLTYDLSTAVAYKNGTQKATTGAVGTLTAAGLRLSSKATDNTRPSGADYAELVICSSALGASDRSRLHTYLGARYGITVV